MNRGLTLLVLCLSLRAVSGEAGRAADERGPGNDLLKSLLAEEDYDAARAELLRALERPGSLPCWRLGAFSEDRNERVREHAVRALSDAGCSQFDSYRPYANDPSPWVTDMVLKAAERRLITGAVPFLISHLTDGRRIVANEGSWTIGESAHRALRVVTCQSFHFDPQGPPQAQADATAEWSRWYEMHRSEPRDSWIASGIALARDYIGRDHPPHRMEGLELLGLIGAPALPALRAAFQRAPQDLRTTLFCNSDEPPRVNDTITCVLLVVNASKRRVALAPAPGDPEARLSRQDAVGPESGEARPKSVRSGGSHPGGTGADPRPSSPRPPEAHPEEIPGRIVDLAPGEALRQEFRVGPALAAGHYELRVALVDLASSLGPSPLPPIEARAALRFEQ